MSAIANKRGSHCVIPVAAQAPIHTRVPHPLAFSVAPNFGSLHNQHAVYHACKHHHMDDLLGIVASDQFINLAGMRGFLCGTFRVARAGACMDVSHPYTWSYCTMLQNSVPSNFFALVHTNCDAVGRSCKRVRRTTEHHAISCKQVRGSAALQTRTLRSASPSIISFSMLCTTAKLSAQSYPHA